MTFTIPFAPPPPHHMSSFSKQIWVVPLWILPNSSAIPPSGFSVTTDPQGINNDRSLMCLAVIMQHANMACHVQRAYKGPTIWLLRGGGGIGDLRKNTLKSDFKHKKSLARKYLPYNGFVCQGKTFYYQGFGGKKFLRKPMKSPIPWSKSSGQALITCRKSFYCLILRLWHQSLIVHSLSKLVHVLLATARRVQYRWQATNCTKASKHYDKKNTCYPQRWFICKEWVQKRGLQARAINALHCNAFLAIIIIIVHISHH